MSGVTDGTDITLYGTTDHTNYDRLRIYKQWWGAYAIASEKGGTGSIQGLSILAGSTGFLFDNGTGRVASQSSSPADVTIFNQTDKTFVIASDIRTATNRAGISLTNIMGGLIPTSGTSRHVQESESFGPTSGNAKFIAVDIAPTINQTGTATGDYTALQVNATETAATGTNKRLLDLQTGATSRMVVTSAGNVGIGTTAPSDVLTVVLPSGGRSIISGTGMYPVMAGGLGWYNLGNGQMSFGDVSAGNYLLFSGNGGANLMGNWKLPAGVSLPSPAYLGTGSTNFGGGNTTALEVSSTGNGDSQTAYLNTYEYAATNPGLAPLLDIAGNGINFGIRTGNPWNQSSSGNIAMSIATSGNVGIGTTSPASKLDVAGGARVGADAVCNDAKAGMLAWNSNTMQVCVSTAVGFVNVASASGGSSQWTTAGSDIYYSGGKVGIGTTVPLAKLHLSGGNDHDVYTNATVALGWSTTGQYPHFIHTRHMSGGSAGNAIDFYTSDGTAAGVYPTNAVLGLSIVAGNVGIGVTSPTNILSLGGDAARTIWMERSATAAATGNSLTLQAGGTKSGNTDQNGGDLVLSSGTSTGSGSSNISFKTAAAGATGTTDRAPATAMTILGNGNVGIGTMSPQRVLDVRGDMRIGGVSGQDYRSLAYSGDGTIISEFFSFNGLGGYVGTNSNHKFFIRTNDTDRITVDTTGNVGIGTTSPGDRLAVAGGGVRITGTPANAIGVDGLTLGHTGVGGYASIQTWNGTPLALNPGGNNVGIGTTSPNSTLQVNGQITSGPGNAAGQGLILNGNVSGAEGGEVILNDVGNSGGWAIDNYSNTIRFYRGGSVYFQFDTANAYKPGGGSWSATSDIRLKNIDGTYEQGLDSIVRLKPVRYHYKKDNARKEPSDRQFYGLVAQDVQKVFPESVSQGSDGYLSLDTTPISFAVINAIKELNAENAVLHSELQADHAAIEELRGELRQMKAAH